jgi:Flp pilus assembly protein TadG
MSRSAREHPRSGQRGATAVFVALTLLVIAGFLALAINVGHLHSVRGELQNGSDSSALAGTVDLNGMVSGLDPAIASAGLFAGYHDTDGQVQEVASPIELGHWPSGSEANVCAAGEVATGTAQPPNYTKFCRVDARDATAALRINAVRVVTSRAAGAPGGGAAPVFMNALLGASSTTDVGTEAVAVSGGPSQLTICPHVPFVIRQECLQGAGAIQCGQPLFLGLGSTPVNTAGWTLFSLQTPNTNALCSYLQNPPPSCSETAGNVIQTGSDIATGNGDNISGSCPGGGGGKPPTLCQLLKTFQGQTVEIPVIDDGQGCMTPYSGTATVTGFATLAITQVYCKGDPLPATGTPCSVFATDQCLAVSYLCDQIDTNDPGGGAWFGTAVRPRLVR